MANGYMSEGPVRQFSEVSKEMGGANFLTKPFIDVYTPTTGKNLIVTPRKVAEIERIFAEIQEAWKALKDSINQQNLDGNANTQLLWENEAIQSAFRALQKYDDTIGFPHLFLQSLKMKSSLDKLKGFMDSIDIIIERLSINIGKMKEKEAYCSATYLTSSRDYIAVCFDGIVVEIWARDGAATYTPFAAYFL